MKRLLIAAVMLTILLCGCTAVNEQTDIVATTLPVYCFTTRLCDGTPLSTTLLIRQSVSCLHDYTMQISQMRELESADVVAVSGAGLEDFLPASLLENKPLIDASVGIPLLEETCHHEESHDGHTHDADPHIWLSPACAKQMVANLCNGLCKAFPEYATVFEENRNGLEKDLDALQAYGEKSLENLRSRELITFHDGFSYFAEAFHLTVLRAVEEESGSEVSASELKELITLVKDRQIPAIFTEKNGSEAAASIIASQTGAKINMLDMGFSETDYFEAMYHNIDAVKEALE